MSNWYSFIGLRVIRLRANAGLEEKRTEDRDLPGSPPGDLWESEQVWERRVPDPHHRQSHEKGHEKSNADSRDEGHQNMNRIEFHRLACAVKVLLRLLSQDFFNVICDFR